MSPWVRHLRERLALAKFLNTSNLDTGRSVAFVQLDNTVELMFKIYLYHRRKLTEGKPPNQKKTEDEWKAESRYFEVLLGLMKKYGKLKEELATRIQDFHKIRCELYHGATPFQPDPGQFDEYFKIAVSLMYDLFDEGFGKDERLLEENRVRQLIGAPQKRPTTEALEPEQLLDKFIKKAGNLITIDTRIFNSLAMKIRAILWGHVNKLGNLHPTIDDIVNSLVASRAPEKADRILLVLRQLRFMNHVKRIDFVDEKLGAAKSCTLTEKGFQALKEHVAGAAKASVN